VPSRPRAGAEPRRRRRAEWSPAAAPSRGARRAPAAPALRSALSLHAERGSLAVLDASAFSAPKTKQAFELLDDWNRPGSTLVVLDADDANAALSFRNLAWVAVLTHENVGVADLLGAASLVISQPALDALTARAAGSARTATEAKA
jgi:large subunit ribosomal protein L4